MPRKIKKPISPTLGKPKPLARITKRKGCNRKTHLIHPGDLGRILGKDEAETKLMMQSIFMGAINGFMAFLETYIKNGGFIAAEIEEMIIDETDKIQ